MRTCGECGGVISSDARVCPRCGFRVPRTKWWLWVPLALLAAFALYAVVSGSTPEARRESQAIDSIEHCWSEQRRKSLTPEAARMLATACETMERDFRRRYGREP